MSSLRFVLRRDILQRIRSATAVHVRRTIILSYLQGRTAAGIVLLALHLGAWELADSIIMAEIPGTHAYVAALSVLGGIATFNNPLQVCVPRSCQSRVDVRSAAMSCVSGQLRLDDATVVYAEFSLFRSGNARQPQSNFEPGPGLRAWLRIVATASEQGNLAFEVALRGSPSMSLSLLTCFALRSCAGCTARTDDCGGAGGDFQPACELHRRRAAAYDASAAVAQPGHIRRERREQAAERAAMTARKQLLSDNCLYTNHGSQQCVMLIEWQ